MALNADSGSTTAFMLVLRLVEFQSMSISMDSTSGTLSARLASKELAISIFLSVYLRLNNPQSQQC